MLVWTRWQGNAARWNEILCKFPDFTIYQSHEWGEHRSSSGWKPLRFVAYYNELIVSIVQVLVRYNKLGIAVLWIPGGPVGQASAWNKNMLKVILKECDSKFFYCRLSSMINPSPALKLTLQQAGWSQSTCTLNKALSLEYSPLVDEDQRMQLCSSNWRHNLRRSFKRDLFISVWEAPDPKEIIKAYEAMQKHKKLARQISESDIRSILTAFAEQCLIIRCDDEWGDLLALRGALILNNKAWDIFAATNPAGRKVYASYAVFWEIVNQCANRGVDWYDMGGADPHNNKGVYDFKKGTGATDISYLGEWDIAFPSLLRPVANYMIGRRKLL